MTGHAYWMVYSEARCNVPKTTAFRDLTLAQQGAQRLAGTIVRR
jgi:hypothetical protein